MKKLIVFLAVVLELVLSTPDAQAISNIYGATCLTGAAACVDGIDVGNADGDGTDLAVGDMCFVVMDAGTNEPEHYVYRLYSTGASESSPNIIKPDLENGGGYAGNLRWYLTKTFGMAGAAVKARYLIAAQDAPSTVGADYICTGTADEVQFQAALDACPAAGQCEIQLTDGTYNFNPSLNTLDSGGTTYYYGIKIAKSYVTIKGTGQGTTRISAAANSMDNANSYLIIVDPTIAASKVSLNLRDIGFIGGSGTNTYGSLIINKLAGMTFSLTDVWFQNLLITEFSSVVFNIVNGWGVMIDNTLVETCTGGGVLIDGTGWVISNSKFMGLGSTHAIHVGSRSSTTSGRIIGNYLNSEGTEGAFEGSIALDTNASGIVVAGNTVYNSGTGASAYGVVVAGGSSANAISGNTFIDTASTNHMAAGVWLGANTAQNVVAGNVFGTGITAPLKVTSNAQNYIQSQNSYTIQGYAQVGVTAYSTGGITNAVALKGMVNEISVCAAAADSVKLLPATAGIVQVVTNHGAFAAALFPTSGDAINGLSANASITIPVNGTVSCYAKDTTNWECSVLPRSTAAGAFTARMDDSAAQVQNSADATKLVKIDASGMTTGKTLTQKHSFDQSATIDWVNTALSADAKTITMAVAASDNATYTFPSSSQTLATLAGTETLTNKTLTAPYITAPEVFIDCNGAADPYSYCTSGSASTLTAAQVSRTIINSYGRAEAQTVTLPTAAAGYTFIAIVGTQHNSAWTFAPGGGSTLYLEVAGAPESVATISETNEVVGSRMSCATFKTGAAAWSWMCGAVSGTWDHTN